MSDYLVFRKVLINAYFDSICIIIKFYIAGKRSIHIFCVSLLP